jgi:hypothetical protein
MSLESYFAEDPQYRQWLSAHPGGFVARLSIMNGGLAIHHTWCADALPDDDVTGGMSGVRLCAGSMADLERWSDGRMEVGISRCPHCATPRLELSPEDMIKSGLR